MRTALSGCIALVSTLLAAVPYSSAASAAGGVEDIPDGTSLRKVLLIDIDGVRWDRLQQAETPNIDALGEMGQIGVSYVHGTDVATTNSGPGHSNILTGVWPDKHKVRENTFEGNDIASYPDLLTRLERHRSELSTFSILDWTPLNTHLIDAPDVKMQQSTDGGTTASDRRTADTVIEAMTEKNPDVGFVYFHDPDNKGHAHGGDSPEYVTAIEGVDGLIGEVVDAVRARPTYNDEDWLFLLTTDHGFDGTGHGTNGHRTRQIWTLAAGGDIPVTGEATREWRQVDIAPTIFAHLDVPMDPQWGLDGIEIGTESEDPFDTLSGELRGVVDEPAKPDGLLGWTKVTPDGWEIDENTPEDSGVAEYRGWSFMTGQFWATSHADQGRESFFRGRDIIAVADPDEWDDKGNPARDGLRLDSELQSPWQQVAPGETVEVSYHSHYRQVERDIDPQKARLLLRYDDGTEDVLWSRDADDGSQFEISRVESFTATAPGGVEQVRAVWHMYDAANNFYWAIDDPRVEVS